MRYLNRQKGQMLLVVVLTMIVALTVGLSVVSRTITSLRISRQTEESQRAFQAAEAGIEQAIQSASGSDGKKDFSNNASFTTTVSNLGGSSFLVNGGETVDQDAGLDVWLSEYPDFQNPIDTNITIFWGSSGQTSCSTSGGDSINPAIEIAILSGSVANPVLTKYVHDGNGCSRITGASSSAQGGSVQNISFVNSAVIPPITDGLIMRIIPIYNSTKIAITVTGGDNLPNQGTVIESVGQAGETVRKVQYFSSHPQIPLEIFPYSLISQ